jgi:hypothetical protein
VLLDTRTHQALLYEKPPFYGQFQVPDDSSLKLYSSPLMVDVV